MQLIYNNLYTGSGFSDWEIGDCSVIYNEGLFHLFHLIIPNHDYVAHAVSKDFINWHRVKNAIFVGDPGEWDDDMIWTMHVCKVNNRFEMYYTGLQRKNRGAVSKVGLAVSDDLMSWEKVCNNIFPFNANGPYYENEDNNPRQWLSFRDPFRIDVGDKTYFLICTRASEGSVYRRGCVGLVQYTAAGLKFLPPMHYPRMYDDVECPCAFELNGRYYLLGSIREDIKVRYWFSPGFDGEYHCFHSNVLLPQGNYAARTITDDGHVLIYSFFYTYGQINSYRVFLPPKQLDTDKDGRLILRTYNGWQPLITETFSQEIFADIQAMYNNPTAHIANQEDYWVMGSRSGYELFTFEKPSQDYIWEGIITVEGIGKLGLISDGYEDGSGYYYSFDVLHGILQLRAWGFNEGDVKSNFVFIPLQNNIFNLNKERTYHFRLIRYGNYIELAIDDIVKLTLTDNKYSGKYMGFYSASSVISLKNMQVKSLPASPDEFLAV